MAKSFKTVDTPTRQPTAEQVVAFVKGGAKAQASADRITPEATPKEGTARLSLDIPVNLHSRYKAACARQRVKMTPDLIALITQRTAELEQKS